MKKSEVRSYKRCETSPLRAQATVFILTLFLSFIVKGVAPPLAVAPAIVPAGGFGIEGDLLANSPHANVGDWLAGTNSGIGGAVLSATGVPLNLATTFHFMDQYNSA